MRCIHKPQLLKLFARYPTILLIACIFILPLSVSASEKVQDDEELQWITCLAQQANSMITSNEPASIVADAAMTLCKQLEKSAHAKVVRDVKNRLIDDRVFSNMAEADRVMTSVESEAWTNYLDTIKKMLLATIVKLRTEAKR